ncbi:MAG: putative lipid II flippase FtsW [Candidatus Magasanikbacteria bacterium CG10_big_fil_rev_8_21_14_0_10_36_16]|uniref:Probable peptidoglycan glycosyltransferase FtsW n=1 Tax=Candidatus Magasanikbacteria bacterium CG10_big_fil_rev_8_21_14_0_10_36_16 TaxID=1974645 RepID=A0A2H0TXN6_9BACT|nr:MAG: putative lipid II flippase FtsW [Candidatus Magasanikbacteria bacterium CG10_big_fil_rev_8_21_14_0_10_36_16]
MRQEGSSKADYSLIIFFFILVLFGLMVLSSAGVAVGIHDFNDQYFFVKRQIFLGFLPGLFLFFLFAKIDYQIWKKYATPIFILGLVLLFLVFVPGIGSTNNTGTRSWINLFGYSFQPAEAMKLALVVYMAAFLTKMGPKLLELKEGFLVALGAGMIPVILIALQPDIGTTSILFVIVLAILYFAQAKFSHILMLFIVAIAGFVFLVVVMGYGSKRFTTFLHPELDPQGQGYQINQAFLAVGSGGLFGLGFGHSRQKFQYLPEVHGDSIFAIMSEELGFLVVVGFLLLLFMILKRGFFIASHTQDLFGKLLVSGIMSWLFVQSFLNIGAIVGILPLTGVPLPFVSHGGSALLIGMASMGIVVSVSKHS